MIRKTKIVATIGPASNSREVLVRLVDAGMNVARLNFSHGSYESHSEVIRNIRSVSRTLNRPVGILLDLQGPKIRCGKNGGGVNRCGCGKMPISPSPRILWRVPRSGSPPPTGICPGMFGPGIPFFSTTG